MPLTTYTAGDVLTAASLNNNFTFAAANPVGGATFVLAQSFSAVSTVSMAASTFTSTYQNYLVMLQITANSVNQNISLRVNNAGTPRTAANYGGAKLDIRQDTGAVVGTGTNAQTSFNMITGGTNGTGGVAIIVFSPLVATTKTTLTAQGMGIDNAQNTGAVTFGGVQYVVAEANDGLTFFVGGTFTGNLRVYGLADS
jgi:hypothetical protein